MSLSVAVHRAGVGEHYARDVRVAEDIPGFALVVAARFGFILAALGLVHHRFASELSRVGNNVALERRLELNFEGHLWFDLDRTGGSISYSDANITRNIAAGDKFWALPIPKSQVDINENLVQNPGY